MPARTPAAHLPHRPMGHARPRARRSRAVLPPHPPRVYCAVGAVFLEGQPQDQDARTIHVDASLQHRLHQLAGHIGAHAVIDTAPCKDHLRVVAHRLGLMGQVVGVHANAVPADETWPEGQEVPLGACGLQHGLVSMPILLKMIANSLTRAMFRSRCVFSMTLAASATRMLSAL